MAGHGRYDAQRILPWRYPQLVQASDMSGGTLAKSRQLPVGLLVAGATVLAGCTAAPKPSAKPATPASHVTVSAANPATLRMANGPQVQVPAHAVSGSGTLAGAQVQPPAPAPEGMSLAGPAFQLRVAGARLTGRVRLTMPVPPLPVSGISGPDAALLAYYDAAARKWVPVPARYDPAAHALTALTPHLSIWTALRVNTGKLLAGATGLLKGFLDISDTTGQPACPGHGGLSAADIITASDKGNLVKWCAGITSGPLLRVADNRHYAMEADYPASWQASHVGDADPLTGQILDDVVRALSPAPGGGKSVIIPGGETEQFTVPPGTGQVNVQPSSEAYLITALLYGADTLNMIMDGLPGAPARSLTKTEKVIKLALHSKDCVTEADHLLQDKITSAATAGRYFRDDVEWAVGCLGKAWEAGYGLSGVIGQFIVSVVLWFADGVRLVVDGVKALIDSAVYWRSYRIAISSPAQAACTAQALAALAHAYVIAHNEPADINEIATHACNQGYAEILVNTSPGNGPQYEWTMAFQAVSGGWRVLGSGDYIPPGSYGMPANVGQALVSALQASQGGNEHVAF
jgi:hypothetical protein